MNSKVKFDKTSMGQSQTQSLHRPYISSCSKRRVTNIGRKTFQEIDKMRKSQQKFRDSLYKDPRSGAVPKTTLKNQVIEDIMNHADFFYENDKIMEQVYKIKELNLLCDRKSQISRLAIRPLPYIYNYYHSTETKTGYSRSVFGGFFTK